MSLTLASLKEALAQPFPIESIRFLPKVVFESNGKTFCTAFPYANKRIYEDRLNAIAFGEWSTPFVAPLTAGNRLIVPVTVVICGVAHTDYGEAFFTAPGKGGPREDENTATEAYSQAFRRACSQFGLGRYLYDLPKVNLPFNGKIKQIALSEDERLAWVEKLYKAQHLHVSVAGAMPAQSSNQASVLTQTPAPAMTPSTGGVPPSAQQPVSYPNDLFLDWVASQVGRDPVRIQDICANYRVRSLAALSEGQRANLTQRLQGQANKASAIGAAASRLSSSQSTSKATATR
ncbi:Rad52/Rad22 family DNA repair protein [Dictyobacter formicarum]|uniref:Uncharacterized protein n=1 Tax=Dictyobacter formicarum TaxID=2778368 RepID=A0ABQ3VR83_9CHLR|nr:Rad52/Rad22 family DNA repair protein [Dictyobacter formicarum]GHO88219.1 hypothetical protein KSZ_62250 [Dictyobacter formicarum]